MHLPFYVVAVVVMIAGLAEERTCHDRRLSYAWYAVNIVKAQSHTYDTYLSIYLHTYLLRTGLDISPFRSSGHLCIYHRLLMSAASL